jgi:hypothetical protein
VMQFSLSDQETVCALRANWKLAQFLLASFNVQFADYPRGIGDRSAATGYASGSRHLGRLVRQTVKTRLTVLTCARKRDRTAVKLRLVTAPTSRCCSKLALNTSKS